MDGGQYSKLNWKCKCGCTTPTRYNSQGWEWLAHNDLAPFCADMRCSHGAVRMSLVVDEPEPIFTILQEAAALTGNGGDRNDSYDHPRENFDKIARVWSVLFGVAVTPQQVALAMIGMKIVRENHKAKRDNWVDIAGYARCIERLGEPTTNPKQLRHRA